MSTPVIVFAKAPVPGAAKSRLAPALGAERAAALAERMLRHTLAEAVAAGVGPVALCAAPDTSHPALQDAAASFGVTLTAQGDGDLGQRMHRAFERHLLERPLAGASGALLIGTDAPALDADVLRLAAAALQQHAAVFVPALDGGYALIGLQRPDERCFAGMRWSHAAVMADTRDRLRAASVGWTELAPVADIDVPDDLVHLPPGWLEALG